MKYRTKSRIKSSVDSVKSAIQSYNSPYGNHRFSDFVILMIVGWNRLFQAYFIENNVNYFYMNKTRTRYVYSDKDKKTWDITESLKYFYKHKLLNEPQYKNLELFINVRNKIEHSSINDVYIMESTFGESQSLLYNFENKLVELFGSEYSLNESLRFTLQFSTIYPQESLYSLKSMMTQEATRLYEYIQKYKDCLDKTTTGSFDFSVRLIQLPDVSNTKSGDLSVTFVRPENQKDLERLKKVTAIIKEKQALPAHIETLKPSSVAKRMKELIPEMTIKTHHVKYVVCPLGIRPYNIDIREGRKSCDDINPKYCVYLSDYGNFSFKQTIFNLISSIYRKHQNDWVNIFSEYYKNGVVLDISQYE